MHSKSVQFSIPNPRSTTSTTGNRNPQLNYSAFGHFHIYSRKAKAYFAFPTFHRQIHRCTLTVATKVPLSSRMVIVGTSTANSGSQAGLRPSSSLADRAIYRHKRKTHLIDYIAALTTRDRRLLLPPIQHTEWGTDSGGNFLVALSCFRTVLDV